MNRSIWLLGLIGALLVHAVSLRHPFISDDHVLIEQNPALRFGSPATPLHLLSIDYWSAVTASGGRLPLGGDPHLYRPATTISYWLNARLTGVRPDGFRIGNILLAGTAASLAGLLAAALVGPAAAPFATVAVLVHPATSDVINRIVGRADLLVLLGLAGFLLLAARGRRSGWNTGRIAACALFALIALGAKETGLVVVPLALLVAIPPGRGRFAALLIAAGTATLFLIARTAVVGWPDYRPMPEIDLLMNPLAGQSLLERLPAAFSLVTWYARMLVVPWPIVSFDRPAVLPGWSSPTAWIGALILVAAIALAVRIGRSLVRGTDGDSRRFPLLVAVGWWLAVEFIVGQFIVPIGTYREIRLVVPLIGSLALFLALAAGGGRWRRGACAGYLLLLLALSLVRALDFRDETALAESDVRHAPRSAVAHLMLGTRYLEVGHAEEGRAEKEAALRLAPASSQVLTDLAALAVQRGDFAAARDYLDRALAVAPGNSLALMNLGNLLAQQGRYAEALEALRSAERLNGDLELIQVNLALVEALAGDRDRALRRAAAIEQRNPDSPHPARIRALVAGAGH